MSDRSLRAAGSRGLRQGPIHGGDPAAVPGADDTGLRPGAGWLSGERPGWLQDGSVGPVSGPREREREKKRERGSKRDPRHSPGSPWPRLLSPAPALQRRGSSGGRGKNCIDSKAVRRGGGGQH